MVALVWRGPDGGGYADGRLRPVVIEGESMQEFDPRKATLRLTPRLMVSVAGVLAAALAGRVLHPPQAKAPAAAPRPIAAASPAAAPVVTTVEVPVKVQSGETLEAAVRRTGVSADDAHQAVNALASAFDIAKIRAGLAFDAAIAQPRDRRGPVRLISLSLKPSPTKAITLSRTFDGALKLKELDEQTHQETAVAEGALNGSLYESAIAAGASPTLTAQVTQLFAHKLDFSRDIHPGDHFRLVFDRTVSASGQTVAVGGLDYAEIGAKGQVTRFYRFKRPGATQTDYFDEDGKSIKGFLLRTPIDGAHITSGFGMRMHPILGYTRMHQGVDFGAPVGTPVYAAGDGVVEEARWAGGYGRWIKLRHDGGWETAYGHLSRWAVRPGEHVRQGQVIAYSGSSGESTGPHLHYEVIDRGQKIDPRSAKAPAGVLLSGHELAEFRVQKAHLDLVMAQAQPQGPQLAQADAPLRR